MTPPTSTVHQPRRDICSHGHSGMCTTVVNTRMIVAIVAGESGSPLCSILRSHDANVLPKQIPKRPLHPLMWIGVVVILDWGRHMPTTQA